MLTLSRKEGQSFFIDTGGEKIEVKILEIKYGKVVIMGVDAPRKFDIWRDDIIKKEKRHTYNENYNR